MSQLYTKEFNAFLSFLKDFIGSSALEKEDESSYILANENYVINLLNQDGNLIYYTNFGKLDQYSQQDLIINNILKSNVLFYETNGSTFGLSQEKVITLCYQQPLEELSKEKFIDSLDNFVYTIEQFTQLFEKIEQNNFPQKKFNNSITDEDVLTENWQKI